VKKSLIAIGVAVVIVCGMYESGAVADAQSKSNHVKASLEGYQEVPAVSTTGTGTLDLRINDAEIEFELTYENLEGATTTAAHIHLGQPGVNGGVSVFLCGGGGRPECTPRSGSFSGVITAANVIGPVGQGIAAGEFDELVRALRAGVTYVNVHTDRNPGGEIRGVIQ
jgi:hypothetical protein